MIFWGSVAVERKGDVAVLKMNLPGAKVFACLRLANQVMFFSFVCFPHKRLFLQENTLNETLSADLKSAIEQVTFEF